VGQTTTRVRVPVSLVRNVSNARAVPKSVEISSRLRMLGALLTKRPCFHRQKIEKNLFHFKKNESQGDSKASCGNGPSRAEYARSVKHQKKTATEWSPSSILPRALLALTSCSLSQRGLNRRYDDRSCLGRALIHPSLQSHIQLVGHVLVRLRCSRKCFRTLFS